MTASLRVECVRCGAVEVPMESARLVPGTDGGATRAEFRCSQCGIPGSIEVDDRAVRLLLAADIPLHAPGVGSGSDRQRT